MVAAPFFSVLKCYKLEVNLLYNISQDQGVVISQLNHISAVASLNTKFKQGLDSKTDCKLVILSSALYNISRLDEDYVSLRGSFTFSLKSSDDTPDDDVARTLKRCLQEFQSSQFVDSLRSSSFQLFQGFYNTYVQNIIEIKEHQSCCGAIPPPCCPGNAIKKSRVKCAPLSFEMSYSNQTRVTLDSKLTASCFASTEANAKIVWRRNGNTIQTTGTTLNQTLIIDCCKVSKKDNDTTRPEPN
ncbi:uncharacterized protein LOC110244196 [Exaiptasia diaphana]|uniref:Uncharacterized protein n=1 Tax=Exaiptasia diaphana TaxID=2652724 RepID=A0A913YMM4_EXADI|nr:uncharacterized protein LOC110244196 [Exaiptasia diaphana]